MNIHGDFTQVQAPGWVKIICLFIDDRDDCKEYLFKFIISELDPLPLSSRASSYMRPKAVR